VLIEKNAKIDETVRGNDGYTLLHKPIHYLQHDEEVPTTFDKYSILRLLCKKLSSNKSAINAKDNDNKTPIMTIINEYSNEVALEACKILIEEGRANIYINDGKKEKGKRKGNTALNFAIMKGNVDLSKYLIRKGADIEHYNDDDMTPLHLAVKYNLPEIVVIIINKNPRTVLAKNSKNETPKDLVIKSGDNKTHSDIIRKFNEVEDNTGRIIHDSINKSYKRKSSKSPEERGFKSARDSVLGNMDLINQITSASKFGGKKKTYKKKCFICKKYNKLTRKKTKKV
jgi:ankyrin repeat protein